MSLVPQPSPSKDDIARELAAAAKFVANPAGATFLGMQRADKSPISWATDCGYREAYPDGPAKIPAGDKAASGAWLRINAEVARLYYAKEASNPSPGWNPAAPTWPLPIPYKASPAGSLFGARRPWSKKYAHTRYHTGHDIKAEPGVPILAPESGTIIAPESGWDYNKKTGQGVKSVIMQTDSGYTILLGGSRPTSSVVKAGDKVKAGQTLAVVGNYPGVNGQPGPSMLHFQLYKGLLTEGQVNNRKSWKKDDPPPSDILDPKDYLKAAGANTKYQPPPNMFGVETDGQGLVPNDVEDGELNEGVDTQPEKKPDDAGADGELVTADAKRNSLNPCTDVLCGIEDGKAWQAAGIRYLQSALAEQAKAKASKKPWTAKEQNAEKDLVVVQQALMGSVDQLTLKEAIDLYIQSCRQALAAGRVFAAFAPPEKKPKKKSSGGMMIAAGLGLALVGVGVAVAVSRGKKRTQKSLVSEAA